MHEGFFRLVNAVAKKNEELEPEDRRLLERYHRDYIRYGLGLSVQQHKDLKEVQQQLVQHISDSERNLREENKGVWFTIEELSGVKKESEDRLNSCLLRR